jgi:exonuclease VII small subunit
MTSATPFLYTLAGILVGTLLTFCLNWLLNRVTNRQNRRIEWYDIVDRDRQKLTQQIESLERQCQQLERAVAEVQRLTTRLEVAESKIGIWWRYVEDQIPDMLRPPPKPHQYPGDRP